MQHIRLILLAGMILVGVWIPQTILSKAVILVNPSGENLQIEVDATDKFLDVMEEIESYFQNPIASVESDLESELTENEQAVHQQPSPLDFKISLKEIIVRKKKWRDYQQPVTKREKAELVYIVNILARESLKTITSEKSTIKKAGDRINHLHPLRFLMTIFTDEELKAGIHAIRHRHDWVVDQWVWEEFLAGIVNSMIEESQKRNLRVEDIKHFAETVKIDCALILPHLQIGKWEEFVDVLILNIPRENDPNRYNM